MFDRSLTRTHVLITIPIMQNVRSKSTTPAGCRQPQWQVPATAGAGMQAAPQLRLVPGRIALFVGVMCLVALLMVPRLASVMSSTSQPQVYVVESGDTLWGMAGEFGGDGDPRAYVDDLLRINHLSSPQVFPGQELVLP